MTSVFANYGIKFKFVGMENANVIDEYITPNTKMIWLETPTNPMLNIYDIEAICRKAPEGVIVVVDNTFASPYLQNPIDLGADLVLHSATKYLGGHSDVVHGAVISKDQDLADKLRYIQNAVGAVPGPQDCFLILRGIKNASPKSATILRKCEKDCRFPQAPSQGRKSILPRF